MRLWRRECVYYIYIAAVCWSFIDRKHLSFFICRSEETWCCLQVCFSYTRFNHINCQWFIVSHYLCSERFFVVEYQSGLKKRKKSEKLQLQSNVFVLFHNNEYLMNGRNFIRNLINERVNLKLNESIDFCYTKFWCDNVWFSNWKSDEKIMYERWAMNKSTIGEEMKSNIVHIFIRTYIVVVHSHCFITPQFSLLIGHNLCKYHFIEKYYQNY